MSFGGISTSLTTCYDIHLIGDAEYSPKTYYSFIKGGQWLIAGEGAGSNEEGQYSNLQRTSNYGNTWTGIPVYMSPIKTIASKPAITGDPNDAKYIIGGSWEGGYSSNSTMQISGGALDGFQPVSSIFAQISYIEYVSTFFVASGYSEESGVSPIQVSEDGIYWTTVNTMFVFVNGIIYNDPPQNNNYTAVGSVAVFSPGYGVIQHISSPYEWNYTTSPLPYEDYKEQTSAVLQLIGNDIYINQNRYTNNINSLQINTEIINSVNSYTGSTYTTHLNSIQFDATSISSQHSYTGSTYTTNLISLEINTDSISSLHSHMGSIYYSYSIL